MWTLAKHGFLSAVVFLVIGMNVVVGQAAFQFQEPLIEFQSVFAGPPPGVLKCPQFGTEAFVLSDAVESNHFLALHDFPGTAEIILSRREKEQPGALSPSDTVKGNRMKSPPLILNSLE